MRERLDDMRERSEADSITEVIRRALSLFDLALKQREGGGEVIFRGPDGDEQKLVLV